LCPISPALTEQEAVAKLRDLGFKLGSVTSQPSPQAQVGRILSQKAKAGSSVVRGAAIDIVIGSDQSLVTVPQVTGSSLERARTLLAKSNLAVGKIDPPDPPETSIVVAQEPKPQTQVALGTAIDLRVRVGDQPPPVISIPNVLK
jgi:eukaryotic-like serine/threonine-protein kinase